MAFDHRLRFWINAFSLSVLSLSNCWRTVSSYRSVSVSCKRKVTCWALFLARNSPTACTRTWVLPSGTESCCTLNCCRGQADYRWLKEIGPSSNGTRAVSVRLLATSPWSATYSSHAKTQNALRCPQENCTSHISLRTDPSSSLSINITPLLLGQMHLKPYLKQKIERSSW